MRRGELLALTCDNVFFDEGLVTVSNTTTQNKKGGRHFEEGAKTPDGVRSINVGPQVLETLRRHRVL